MFSRSAMEMLRLIDSNTVKSTEIKSGYIEVAGIFLVTCPLLTTLIK